jgi:hypothetical protein
VLCDFATGECISYIRLRPLFSGWGDNACPSFEAARCQRYIGSDARIRRPDAFGNPVVGCICSVADENRAHVRRPGRPDWSRAIRDNENFDLETRRHAVDLLAHRARITIDVNVSNFRPAFLLNRRLGASEPLCGA